MAAKDSDKNQWNDPKDYGLPFVEISPIRAKSVPVEAVATLPVAEPKVEQLKETRISAVAEEKPKFIPATPVTNEKKQEIQKPFSPIHSESKKTASWVWAVLFLGLGIVAFILWQIQSQTTPSGNIDQPEISEESSVVETTPSVSVEPEFTATDSTQSIENQDSIQVTNNSNPNISKPAETGTTIANVASGNLIRVESKAERPQYFIIVGSLPNEKLAIEEASQYFGKSSEMYLISPEEGSRNYRLGLSKFGSFRLAAEELERIKSQYTEELWILKY